MNWIFLQSASMSEALVGLGIAAVLIFLVIGVGLWIYSALAFSAIARKAGSSKGALAWIPGVGPLIVSYILSGMHWWPWLLLISIAIAWIPILGWIVYPIAMIVFGVYSVIWMWKTFEAVGKPGWWAILYALIPIVNLILLGIAAWGSSSKPARK